MTMSKVAVVTGGSSGIGAATVKALAEAGYQVYELSRRDNPGAGFTHISADITDRKQIDAAVEAIIAKEGRIDLLVNNAGTGVSGAVEFTEIAAAEAQCKLNLFALVSMIQAVIPQMRKQGGGRIINISSVAAVVPIPFQAWYSASKAAVNSLTMALGNELRPFGISVCAVQPGDIRTGFTAARNKVAQGDDVYGGVIGRSVARMEKDEQNGMAPECIARAVCRIAKKRKVKPFYTVGLSYQFCVFIMRLLPYGFANRLIGMLYAK